MQHICAKCWTLSHTIAWHIEFSEYCPSISASQSSPLDPSPISSASLLSDARFSNNDCFPDVYDYRLFKTFRLTHSFCCQTHNVLQRVCLLWLPIYLNPPMAVFFLIYMPMLLHLVFIASAFFALHACLKIISTGGR